LNHAHRLHAISPRCFATRRRLIFAQAEIL
jgi:hypothetical protein